MKKCLVLGFALLLSFGVVAKEATLVEERPEARTCVMHTWTPFALTIAGPVGLPWGDWNVKGLQIGLWNDVYEMTGLQIGLVNIADRAYGVQIGVVNVIASDDVAFLPILNWNF